MGNNLKQLPIGFPIHKDDWPKDRWSIRRYKLTLKFIKRFIPGNSIIYDMGTPNGLGEFMKINGFTVINTSGKDFDLPEGREELQKVDCDCVTALEIIEHLMNPLDLLLSIPGKKLVVSVPLRLWFAKMFWNKRNPAGRHFNEPEIRQFNWLLEKAGWEIIATEKHTSQSFKLGFRTILRWIVPRYYFVYCIRK
jgi:hypothetical protein